MKVLFLSQRGQGLTVANSMASEGHDVSFFCRTEPLHSGSNGIVTFVDSWRPVFKSQDLIVCDSAGFGQYERVFRENAKLIVGCSEVADLLTLDLEKSLRALGAVGVKIPISHVASTEQDLSDVFESQECPYLAASIGNPDSPLVYELRSESQCLWAFSALQKPVHFTSVPNGFRLVCQGWFNGRNWLDPFFLSIPEQETIADSHGTRASMGTITRRLASGVLSKATLELFTEKFRATNYRGPVAVHCVVSEGEITGLRVECGIIPGLMESQLEGISTKTSTFDFFYDLALSKSEKINTTYDYTIAVPVFVDKMSAGAPIGYSDVMAAIHLHFCMSFTEDKGLHMCVGGDGPAFYATARGRTVDEARSRVYRTLRNVYVPGSFYSRNVGKKESELISLNQWNM